MINLTQSELKRVLHYNLKTGVFTWKVGNKFVGQEAGWLESHGYRRININYKTYYAHRLAHLYVTSIFPENEVDHKNQNRRDNSWENISKSVTKQENKRNNSLRADNKSGFNGVRWNKDIKRWEARITIGKPLRLGCFKLYSEACNARKEANIKYGFHPNHGINKTQYQGL